MNIDTASLVLYSFAARPFYCTQAQAEVLDCLKDTNKGGIAGVQGYRPSTDYITRPVVNLQVITRYSYANLNARKRAALEAIKFADVVPAIERNPLLSALSVADAHKAFDDRKAMLLESIDKTASGDREDAHRQGHDRCYIQVAEGVKVNLEGEKDKTTGLKEPTLLNGYPVAAAVMVMVLELNRTVIVEGEKKIKKSGVPVLMGNAIESLLNKRSVGVMSLSLKADNFDRFTCSGQVLTPDDLKKAADKAAEPEKLLALMEACGYNA